MNSKETNYYNTIESIMKTSRYITDQVATILKPYDVTESQYNVMRILEDLDGGPATIHEIQKEMYHQSSNVSRIIDKLVAKELVTRETKKENRRKMDILLTHKGFKAVEAFNDLVQNFHQPLMDQLTEGETEHLSSLLKKMHGSDK